MKRRLERWKSRKAERLDAEAKALEERIQQRLRDIDRFHTERLCERYRHLVPPERIQKVKDLPTVFEDRKAFERSYAQADGRKPPEGHQVAGFSRYTLEPAHVDMDNPQLRKNAVHERVHQLSDPRARELLGEKVHEGITEDVAIKELGEEPNAELPRSYSQERATARKLRELCGDGAVDRAYFQGDARELRSCLEHRLGKGNLEKLKDAADAPVLPDRPTEKEEG
jgi:hypothetical protein